MMKKTKPVHERHIEKKKKKFRGEDGEDGIYAKLALFLTQIEGDDQISLI